MYLGQNEQSGMKFSGKKAREESCAFTFHTLHQGGVCDIL